MLESSSTGQRLVVNAAVGTARRARLYVYPNSGRAASRNPYIGNLVQGLSAHFDVVNRGKRTNAGILGLMRQLPKTDALLLNWIENTPDRRWGHVQALLAYLLLVSRKLLGIKVVWVLHNKLSHAKSNAWAKKALVGALLKHSDLIVTHAREGVRYAAEHNADVADKIHFLHHPVGRCSMSDAPAPEPDIDVLIWGSMYPYKGILEFLESLDAAGKRDRFKVLIWGRFSSDEYFEACRRFASEKIEIRNEFISDAELTAAQARARVILFPYKSETVLSSGALMTSLDSRAMLVGPDTGAFRDLAKEGCVETFGDAADMIDVIEKAMVRQASPETLERRRAFFADNSWDQQCGRLARLIGDTLSTRAR